MIRWVWLAGGWIALALAAIGAALPVLPTVPFVLIAVWCFARSSDRLRQQIEEHRHFGPHVRAWQERGAVSRRAKVFAIGGMAFGVMVTTLLGLDLRLVALQAGICAIVAIYLVMRPET